jgi:hypothetical protein
MKTFLSLLMLLFSCTFSSWAQGEGNQPDPKKERDIEALKVAYLSRELELSPEEAQRFWPLYNQYSKEMRTAVTDDQDVLDRDEKVLNLRKRYRDEFGKVLGPQRVNRMYGAEGRFRQLLLKQIRQQRMQQSAPGQRPGQLRHPRRFN